MRFIKTYLKNITLAALALLSFSSCNVINEEEGDCDPYFKVRFIFERNMLDVDAFYKEVSEVDLYVYDTAGRLVWKGHEEGAPLAQQGYLMDLPIEPGTYDMVAWCRKRHQNAADFDLAGGSNPQTMADMRTTLQRDRDGQQAHSSTDLHALFHGKVTNQVLPEDEGTHIVTIPLTKDTNSIRIMLVHLSGKPISKDDFDFKITDTNGYLDHDNTILDDEPIEYRAWALSEGIASTELPVVGGNTSSSISPLDPSRAPITQVHSVLAEMTTSRLQTYKRPMLTITRRSDGEKVVDIPIIDYFLMVKGEYRKPMEDNEFLDRQDDYNMTFFMNEDGSWYRAVLDILQWRVVRQVVDDL